MSEMAMQKEQEEVLRSVVMTQQKAGLYRICLGSALIVPDSILTANPRDREKGSGEVSM
jgi:hypothetical protein